MVTLSSADNALKSFYLEAITDSLDKKTSPFLAQIEKTSVNVTGKDVKKLVRNGINSGVGVGTETGDLPSAGEGDYITLTSTLKNMYGTIEISDKALRASANNEGAFVNILNDEMRSLVDSAKYHFSRMLFGDGSSFIANIDNSGDNYLKVSTTVGLTEGMRLHVLAAGGATIPAFDYVTVSKVDRETNKVYVKEGAVFTGLNLVGGEIYAGQKSDMELTGLGAIFSESVATLYGQDKNSAFMTPYRDSGASFYDMSIQKAMDKIEENSGSAINFMICSYDVRRKIMQVFKESNIELPTIELEGGVKALSYNGVPIVADRFCPAGTLYLLNTDDFKLHQLCDWQWLEAEDGKILKQVPGKPVYTATLVKYAELICERPCGQGIIENIL